MTTSPAYPKRLIEVDLPIKRISAHSRREKSIRHGHISTLHIWWARRPLAACRAVICAALWPDPADEKCPERFIGTAKKLMYAWSSLERQSLLSSESRPIFESARNDLKFFDDLVQLRQALLNFITDFSNWDNSNVKDFIGTSQELTQIAHESLGGNSGVRPIIIDPFAGGGSIPLEALRIGADAFASDLNPVAVLLNKVVLEYIPKHGQRLSDDVRKYGEWVKEQAVKELEVFYPQDEDGAIPVAYLWARTIKCEAPNCGVDVPLLGNLWLSKRHANSSSIALKTKGPGHPIQIVHIHNPKNVANGLTSGNSATCPACGYTTPVTRVRYQLSQKKGGSTDAILLAVVVEKHGVSGKQFRAANEKDLKAVKNATVALKELEKIAVGQLPLIPDEKCPPDGALGFRFQKYGITHWRDLYTPRQLLTLCIFTRIIASKKLFDHIKNEVGDDLAIVIQTILGLAVGRLNDRLCTLCRWRPDKNNVEAANGGQNKMPMLLDFAESTPFGGSSGDWTDHIEWIIRVIDHISMSGIFPGTAQQGPAQNPILPEDSASAIITDPPYFDAFGYSDLSEFFHIWLRRAVPNKAIDLQSKPIPKQDEAISIGKELSDGRGMKDAASYSKEMTRAFKSARQTVIPWGIGVVVFANKTTAGWEAILDGLLEAGWIVTASWPIDTELANRQRAIGSAALNSSVHIVCRPREYPDGKLRKDEVGDWRDVLSELPRRIHEWMPRLAKEGVVGADAIFACLGPALEIFSRYSKVEKANGEQVKLKEFLEHVWAAVSKEALAMVFEGADASGFEPDARLTAMWLWTLQAGTNDDETENLIIDKKSEDEENIKSGKLNTGFSLEYDTARKIGQGLGANLENLKSVIEISGDRARLLSVGERARLLFGKENEKMATPKKKREAQLTLFEVIQQSEDSSPSVGEAKVERIGETVLDRIHQSMILFAAGRGDALKRFLVEDGVGQDQRFWRLSQALSALYPSQTDEKRWVDGVLARKKGLGF